MKLAVGQTSIGRVGIGDRQRRFKGTPFFGFVDRLIMLNSIKSFILVIAIAQIARGREFQFLNTLPGEVWVGCQGNPGHPALNNGGWKLAPGQRMSVYSADNWAGRFWGRSWCDSDTNHCQTGDCVNRLQGNGAGGAPPASLVEITLKGADGLDFYDVSLVDGFNIEISIQPLGGVGDGGQYSCKYSGCTHHILTDCPQPLQTKGSNGQVIGCNSACNAFNTDEYCCRGAHDKPKTCKSTDWPVNYPKYFKDSCPDAYSYAYDDHKSTFTCNAPAYLITFGG